MKIYDISMVISQSLPVFPGDPCVDICNIYQVAEGDACNVTQLRLGSHSGTHADMPRHLYDEGADCVQMPLDYFYGKAKVFQLAPVLNGRRLITVADIKALDIDADDIILFNTGSAAILRDSGFQTDYVSLSLEAAAYLVAKKIKTVGTDALSIESYDSEKLEVHRTLLKNNIAILEGLDLAVNGGVPQGTYTLMALPLKIKGGDGSPVRAILF